MHCPRAEAAGPTCQEAAATGDQQPHTGQLATRPSSPVILCTEAPELISCCELCEPQRHPHCVTWDSCPALLVSEA